MQVVPDKQKLSNDGAPEETEATDKNWKIQQVLQR